MTGTVTHVIRAEFPKGAAMEVTYVGEANTRPQYNFQITPTGECILNEDGLIKLGQVISHMHGDGNGGHKVTL